MLLVTLAGCACWNDDGFDSTVSQGRGLQRVVYGAWSGAVGVCRLAVFPEKRAKGKYTASRVAIHDHLPALRISKNGDDAD